MATITGTALIDRTSVILQDTTNIRWPRSELLGWLNDGQREIVLHKPNAYIKNQVITLANGSKQTLPSDGVALIDVPRNQAGNAIRVVSREILDAQIPGWHASASSSVTKHYVYSPLDPKTFYVYPPSSGNNVDLVYAASPTDIAEGATILVDDIYATALINYMLFRAYSKDAEYASNKVQADSFYGQFQALLGAKVTAETITAPNQALAAFNPNVPASQK
jgi:hypothetical protein